MKKVRNKLQTLFDITTQEGNAINFLNLQIIQSKHAISFDQTEHILEMVEPFFPSLQKFTPINTPLPTDKKFEDQFEAAGPCTANELKLLETEFGGSYLTLFGKLLHVSTISRPQIAIALNRLGKFQSYPQPICFHMSS